MRGYVLNHYGDATAMTLRDVPAPAAEAGSVLIRVHAAGLNPIDYKIRQGKARLLYHLDLPLVAGSELAGVVAAMGPGVTRFAEGDRVFARVDKSRLGAFADYAVVSESLVAKMPARLHFVQAAGLPLAGLTALQALRDELRMAKEDRLYISGGAGGVGTMAIQIAKWMGAEVATTASSRGDALVRRLGADHVIYYTREKARDVLHDYDAALDVIGGDDRGRLRLPRAGPRPREGRRPDGLSTGPSRSFCSAAGQDAVELVARADAELGEDLVQVVFNRARAHEELGRDLWVGQAVSSQPGNLRLPGGEPDGDLGGALADALAGGTQLARGSFREPVGSHACEHPGCGAQLLAGVDAPVCAAQPLAVEQMSAPEFPAQASAAELVDCLAVESLGVFAVTYQRPGAGLDAERPISPTGAGDRREPWQGGDRELGYPAAGRCLDELGYRPVGEKIRGRLPTRLLRRDQRLVIATKTVAQHRRRPANEAQPLPLTLALRVFRGGLDQLRSLGFGAPEGG
jgi:hypothetical protein